MSQQPPTPPTPPTPVNGSMTLSGLGQALLGQRAMAFASPFARGKDLFFHGSNPANYEAIRREGIKTVGEMAERGHTAISHVLDTEAREASKDMAFVSKSLGSARGYQAQAQLPGMDIGPRPPTPPMFAFHRTAEEAAAGRKVAEAAAEWDTKMQVMRDTRAANAPKQMLKDLLHGNNPLKIEFPHGGGPTRAVNPEIEALKNRGGLFGNLLGEKDIAMKALSKEPGIVGGVAPEFIRGAKGFKWISGGGIKAAPLRAALGMLGVAGGAALAGHGLSSVNNGLVQPLLNRHKSASMNKLSSQHPTEAEYYKRRHRLLKILPTLLGALYGGGIGVAAGGEHPVMGGLAGAGIGAGLGYGAGTVASKAYDYMGIQPFTRGVTSVPSPGSIKMAAVGAYHPTPESTGDRIENFQEIKRIVDALDKHPEKLAPAKDVLNGTSMTVPKSVARGAAGAGIGAIGGTTVSHLFDGEENTLDDRKRNEKHHRIGAGLGGILGLYLASHKDINSNMFDGLRQKLAL